MLQLMCIGENVEKYLLLLLLLLKVCWTLSVMSGTIKIKYASDADGSDSPGNPGSASLLWVSVFLRSSELCHEFKCHILALCAVYTITSSDAASGLSAWHVLFNTGVLTWSGLV